MNATLNKVELLGYAGMNAELVEFEKGNALLKFSLATNEDYQKTNGEWVKNTTWHNIVMWGEAARKASKEVTKGAKIQLQGKIVSQTYTDKSGVKRISFKIQTEAITPIKEVQE